MKKYTILTFLAIILLFSQSIYGQKNLTFKVNGASFTMVFVEGGSFVVNKAAEQGNCFAEMRPTYEVTLEDFYMGELQVTQELWHAVMGTDLRQQWLANQYAAREWMSYLDAPPTFDVGIVGFSSEDYAAVLYFPGEGKNYPMYLVNLTEGVLFCNILNKLLAEQLPQGYRFYLPTEAQWEYAASGGKMSKGYAFSGSNQVDAVAWYSGNCEGTSEVGKKMKNELGIYDMSGNIWEWCRDIYLETEHNEISSLDLKKPKMETQYILRGGSWGYGPWGCRTTARNKDTNVRTIYYGFRIALASSY
jgi:formylglycine-generating enzyme required for sulfatase activity